MYPKIRDDTSKSASRFHDENDEILAQVARSGHGVTTHGAEHEPDQLDRTLGLVVPQAGGWTVAAS